MAPLLSPSVADRTKDGAPQQARFAFGCAPILRVVSYGLGVDSTALLVGLSQRGVRPDLILFADVGAERPATYAYLSIINEWLEFVGFPRVTVVRATPGARGFKHAPGYATFEEILFNNAELPAIAFGNHDCSVRWKIAPQDAFLNSWRPAQECWGAGGKVVKMIGYEDCPHEHGRRERRATYAAAEQDGGRYQAEYPLQEWHWDRLRCADEISKAGLPVPPKSSCYFCTASKPQEIADLPKDYLRRIVMIEARAKPRLRSVEGLWRKSIKGQRGATPRPGAMTDFIRSKGLLPAAEIDALIALTPTHHFTRETFAATGYANWQEWIRGTIAAAQSLSIASDRAA